MSNIAIVTGGGTGIGRAIAERLAAEGAEVVITGRRAEVLSAAAAEIDGTVRAVTLDGTDPEAIQAFVDREITETTVLVNNAGGNTDFDHPEPGDLSALAASWRRNLESNLVSAVLMTEAVLPTMTGGGAIISIGSIAAEKGAESYGAAKAGLASWNIGLARRVGERGITANVVSPGYIARTEFFRDALTDARRDSLIDAAMTKRAGAPTDIANMVAFLAHPDSRQITAQTFAVNGGECPSR
ncbi:SDR family NAD(P)-dependent oxidoreductase [Tsukamurella sp. DT100]|uniref:SDR family NAD(P)-dependent oxidoreductase n=1 Tax=Tsukamurella sp. DT100 TaxID=3393415 RepID=UPI003CF77476